MSTTTERPTDPAADFPRELTEADRPERCPRWCRPSNHDLEESQGRYDTEEAYQAARSEFQTHFAGVAGHRLMAQVLDQGSTLGKVKRDDCGGWELYLSYDPGDFGKGDWTLPVVMLDAREQYGPGARAELRLTAAEALLLARQLQVAAEALEFDRPVR